MTRSSMSTWSSPPALLRPEELDPGEDAEAAGFLACAFGFVRAAGAAAGVGLLALPRLPFLPNQGAGDGRRHSQGGDEAAGGARALREAAFAPPLLLSRVSTRIG